MFLRTCRIETLLAEKGMTKSDLASRSGISRQSVGSVIKRGSCHPVTAGKLARGLEVPVDEIVLRSEVVYK